MPLSSAVIDTHVHFIDPARLTYPWLEGILDRSHTPAEYAGQHITVPQAIAVEAGRVPEQAGGEVSWLHQETAEHPWIRGIVAHADIEAPHLERTLTGYSADRFVVGVRRNLQDEADGYVSSPAVLSGVRLLGEHAIPFDACVRARQLPELAALARACPGTVIVLDHLGKPSPGQAYDAWRAAIRELSALPNVVCKLSGLATEAPAGTPRDYFIRTLTYVLETFGADRCMYGSDWPVIKLATTDAAWFDLVREAVEGHDAGAMPAVMAGNAERIYLQLDAL